MMSVKPPAMPRPSVPSPAQEPPREHHEENPIPKDLKRPGVIMIIAVALLLLVLLGAMFVIGWVPHQKEAEQAKADATTQANDVPVVSVAPPKQAAPTSDLSLPCDVHAFQETAIFPRTNGYLKKLNVDIQSQVKAGDVMAEIESPEVDAELLQAQGVLAQAKAALKKAGSDLELAQSTLDRYREIQKSGNVVTEQEFEEKENAVRQATGSLEQAKANLVAADATVQRFTVLQSFEKVIAPFDGVVTKRQYDVGALLSATDTSPGKEMFDVAEVDKLRAFVSVPQVYAADVQMGGEASLKVANHPGTDFTGTVALNSGSVDQNTRTMLFELHFPNKDGKLFAGMYGTAMLHLSQSHQVLLIPASALKFDASGVRVAVVRDGKIHLQDVQLGRDLGTELEVVAGLSPTDKVVTNPGERIVEGSDVKVVEATQPTTAPEAAPKQASTK